MIEDLQQYKYLHTMNKTINQLYFSNNTTDLEFGYKFHSKYSKIKDKYVIFDNDYEFQNLSGEIITDTKILKFSKTSEIVYNLDKVFDRTLYQNKKKYQNVILSPKKLIEKHNIKIRLANLNDLCNIKILHDDWCRKKLENPKTHRISFSSNRYFRCVELGLSRKDCIVLVATISDKIIGCRVVAIGIEKMLFDAAFFTEFWKISQLSESVNIATILYLKNLDFEYLNTGLATGTLKKYKQHFPHHEIFVYRKNNIIEKNTIDKIFNKNKI